MKKNNLYLNFENLIEIACKQYEEKQMNYEKILENKKEKNCNYKK